MNTENNYKGAISFASQKIFNKAKKKFLGKQGSISSFSKHYLESYSGWKVSQGISDDLKKYLMPLPVNHQSTCPDAEGLKRTAIQNGLYDQAMLEAINEARRETVNFSHQWQETTGKIIGGLGGAAIGGLLGSKVGDNIDTNGSNFHTIGAGATGAIIGGGLGSFLAGKLGAEADEAKFVNDTRTDLIQKIKKGKKLTKEEKEKLMLMDQLWRSKTQTIGVTGILLR